MKTKAVYEVRVEVDLDVAEDYLIWLREHMKQIVEVAGFERADLFSQRMESSTVCAWVVHYVATSMETVDEYLQIHSQKFRADGVERFGGRFRIERRILSYQEAVPHLTGLATS